jgi:ribosome-associated protein
VPQRVTLRTPDIALGSFLKWVGAVPTGGQAKTLLREGHVRVNGEIEQRRNHRLRAGDEVDVEGIGSFRLEVNAD